jgi:hypothetical protein
MNIVVECFIKDNTFQTKPQAYLYIKGNCPYAELNTVQ